MKKLWYALGLLTLVGLVVLLGFEAIDAAERRREAERRRVRLPDVELADLDDVPVAVRTGEYGTVLVFFTTTCRYCRAEMISLARHADVLEGARVLFVTMEEPDSVRAFSRETGIDRVPAFRIVRDSLLILAESLYVDRVPTILVYDADGRLSEAFEGFTPIEQIAESIRGQPPLEEEGRR